MFIIYQANFARRDALDTDFLIIHQSATYNRAELQKRMNDLGFQGQLTDPFAPASEAVEKPNIAYELGVAKAVAQTIGQEGPNKIATTRFAREGADWTYITEWTDAPEVAERPTVMRQQVSRTEYYGLFTPAEEAAIRVAASEPVTPALLSVADDAESARLMGVASLAVMLRRIDQLGPDDRVDLTNPQVIAGLDLAVTAQRITAARRDEILLGVAE